MTQREQPRFIAIVPAGGRGERFGAELPKQYLPVAGRPLISYTLRALLAAPWIEQVVVVIAPLDSMPANEPTLKALTNEYSPRLIWSAVGGPNRQASVQGGLQHVWQGLSNGRAGSPPWVMVHDAARPGVSLAQLEQLRQAIISGAPGALLATRVADTVKSERPDLPGHVDATVPRDGLWLAQTPQVFRLDELRAALSCSPPNDVPFTDESSAMEHAGIKPVLVPGSWQNLKVTTPSDLELLVLALQLNSI